MEERKKWKLDFVNKGKEFTLPKYSEAEADMQVFLDLQKLRLEAENDWEHAKPKDDTISDYKERFTQWDNLRGMQYDLYITDYFLKRIDPDVTIEQVRKMDRKMRTAMVRDIFQKKGRREGKGFRKAPENKGADKNNSQPEK